MPHEGLPTFRSVSQELDNRISRGELSEDAAQRRLARQLDGLLQTIADTRLAAKTSALGWLFGRKQDRSVPRGLYIHGDVGRGKTMLMDMFFARVPARRKRRVHFNDFMADAHDRIQRHRQGLKEGRTKESDPIPVVAVELAEQARVLCFDEFAVTDIADAMILSRLFSALFARRVVIVATSNVAPEDLYRDGLNRGLFLPFIETLKAHCDVVGLAGARDYRRERLSRMPVYMTPLGPEADAAMDEAWQAATEGHSVAPGKVKVKGREVQVPLAGGRAARFSFAELCEKPLGARDYLAIAAAFDTIFIDHIPVLRADQRNEAKRFILLIDTLYDQRLRLVASAEAEPEQLYAEGKGRELFEFQRTASRLSEMRTAEWPPAPDPQHSH